LPTIEEVLDALLDPHSLVCLAADFFAKYIASVDGHPVEISAKVLGDVLSLGTWASEHKNAPN
jgi:hypothetical protein